MPRLHHIMEHILLYKLTKNIDFKISALEFRPDRYGIPHHLWIFMRILLLTNPRKTSTSLRSHSIRLVHAQKPSPKRDQHSNRHCTLSTSHLFHHHPDLWMHKTAGSPSHHQVVVTHTGTGAGTDLAEPTNSNKGKQYSVVANVKTSESTVRTSTNAMATTAAVPKYLYRAWTNKSNGCNAMTYLAPQLSRLDPQPSTKMLHDLRFDDSLRQHPKTQLKLALKRKPNRHSNSSIFFTSSFPQSIVHADWKHRCEAKNVWITCLNTTTARTPNGDLVKFFKVPVITKLMKIKLPDRHAYEELDFEDVWMTCDIVIPGDGSSIGRFDDLFRRGLYRCVPELKWIRSFSAGVASPMRNLREYWFKEDAEDLTEEEFNFAAQLAALFEPIWSHETSEYLQMHIFAWILTMKEQGADLPGLSTWLARYGTRSFTNSPQHGTGEREQSELCEVQRFHDINDIVGSWSVKIEEIQHLDPSISEAKVKKRRQDYRSKIGDISATREDKRVTYLTTVDEYGNKKIKKSMRGRRWSKRAREKFEWLNEGVNEDEGVDAEDPEVYGN